MATTRMNVSLDTGHVEWFNETYKGASLSWLLNLLLEKFKDVNNVKPEDYAKLAAEQLKEELNS